MSPRGCGRGRTEKRRSLLKDGVGVEGVHLQQRTSYLNGPHDDPYFRIILRCDANDGDHPTDQQYAVHARSEVCEISSDRFSHL